MRSCHRLCYYLNGKKILKIILSNIVEVKLISPVEVAMVDFLGLIQGKYHVSPSKVAVDINFTCQLNELTDVL